MKNEITYGAGNLSYSIIGNTINNFFMFYGTSVLGLGGALTGLAVAISTAWNGLGDPIVGYISDRFTLGKFGHRKGYMLFATIAMTLANLAVWGVSQNLSAGWKFLWVFLSLMIIQTAITFYTTPYSALGMDISQDKNNTTRIMMSKTVFMMLGMVLPSALITVFLPNTSEYPVGQLNPAGYLNMAYVTSALCALSAFVCILFVKSPQFEKQNRKAKISFRDMIKHFKSVFGYKNLRTIIIASALSDVSAVILMSVGMHFFTYCFYYTSRQITVLLITLLVGATASQVFWYKMSKVDKRKTILTSIFITVSGVFSVMMMYVFRFELNAFSYYFSIASMALCGVGSGALYTIPISMYTDEVKKINAATDRDNTATYTGMLTFMSSASTAFAQLASGFLLDVIHFDYEVVDQTLGVQTGLALILFGGIMSVLILSYYFFAKYKTK